MLAQDMSRLPRLYRRESGNRIKGQKKPPRLVMVIAGKDCPIKNGTPLPQREKRNTHERIPFFIVSPDERLGTSADERLRAYPDEIVRARDLKIQTSCPISCQIFDCREDEFLSPEGDENSFYGSVIRDQSSR